MRADDSAQPTRLIGYVRCSTEEQATGGVTLDAQKARLKAYVDLFGGELVEVIEDPGQSAKTLRRPGLIRALRLLDRAKAQGVVVAKLDRLTRSVRDLGQLLDIYFGEKAGFALLSVAEQIDTRSAGGRLVLNMLASVSQWERETTAERTSTALRHLRSQGVRLGGSCLGWKRLDQTDERGRKLVEADSEEGLTIARILDLRAEQRSLREIASILRHEGRKTKRGGDWHASTVRAVIGRAA